MNRLPVVSGTQLIAALERVGYLQVRQKGSHIRLRCKGDRRRRPTTVPLHSTIRPGTLLGILDDAGLSREEFTRLLD